MGASESREGNLNDSDTEEEEDEEQDRISHASDESFHSAEGGSTIPGDLNLKMGGLSLRASASRPAQSSQFSQRAKLYHYIKSGTPQAKWILADKAAPWEFAREDGEEEDGDYEEGSDYRAEKKGYDSWVLQIGRRIKCRVDQRLQMRFFDEQMRVDFVFQGVWAMKFMNTEDFNDFKHEFQNCLFENIYFLEATEENKLKIFGKEFIGWLKPQEADEAIWEDAKENLEQPPVQELKESQVEPMEEGIRSLTLGALGNSFLVGDSKIEAYRNTPTGLQGKGISVRFKDKSPSSFISPKKAILMKGETNMMFMSPMKEGKPHAAGVHQLDIETGKIVTEWKFEKDGTPISMRDMTNDSKGAQLDSSLSTFLGLDDNRLCRWDMRDRRGNVQDLVSPVLNWADGHQFSRGTNFECFASTGDGGIVVGSKDGKVRLYGTTSMRQAKTAFPGLGSPITHVDVTYDGKWVLATTDTYMILISTVFIDKDGKMKNGFTGRMGNRIAAPRLLKLTPVDAHLAGKNQKFHAGHFSWVTESGKEERHLVVSVGNFTVIWDFSRVRQSNHKCYKSADGLKSCYCYKIVPKDESIVDSKFMHENFHTGRSPGAPLVVATPSKVSSFNI